MSTAMIVPADIQLPAHLRTPDAAAAIAAMNAAAAGGIKSGGFPRISIAGSKFHEVEGGEKRTYMAPTQPGQQPVPLMCLEAVIVAANPAIIKTYYPGKFKDGDDGEPACSSDNGLTPDAHIAAPQSSACATCPMNQWGSKISEASGKEVKACTDSKRLVILPVADLSYKALALSVTPSALKEWGNYVKTLSAKGVPLNAIVTNVGFDHNANHPKLTFSFNRFLTEAEYAKVQERAAGDDVKMIVNPTRSAAPQLPLPAATPAAPPAQVAPAQPAPAPAPAAPVAGFGTTAPAAPAAPAEADNAQPSGVVPPAAAAPVKSEKPKRQPRNKAEADPRVAHLSPELQAAIASTGGPDGPTGQAILAANPAPAAPAPAPVAPVQPAAPAAPATGFGGGTVTAPPAAAAPATSGPAMSLQQKLAAKLGKVA